MCPFEPYQERFISTMTKLSSNHSVSGPKSHPLTLNPPKKTEKGNEIKCLLMT